MEHRTNYEKDRLIYHCLPPSETEIHFFMDHTIRPAQKKTFKALHGSAKIKHDRDRFEGKSEEEILGNFLSTIIRTAQRKEVAGVYFVGRAQWKTELIENHLADMNGTTFGWFAGFGRNDFQTEMEQKLFYMRNGVLQHFPVEVNFGRTPLQNGGAKDLFSSLQTGNKKRRRKIAHKNTGRKKG